MREILFRGKRIDNGEWVVGIPWIFSPPVNKAVIVYAMGLVGEDDDTSRYCECHEVDPSTIGQYTGLTANGKKIFEGDIVRETITSYYQPIGKIYYDAKNCQWRIAYVNNIVSVGHIGDGRIYELLGNIYDTPMLLEDNP